MDLIRCRNCDKEYDDDNIICPYCDTPTNPEIPNYPRFRGPGVIITMWILFLALVASMMISMFTQN